MVGGICIGRIGGGFGIKEMEGAADALMVPDPTTFRVLPWSPNTGWLLCDIYFGNGKPIPFSTRELYRSVLNRLGERGYDFVAGLEVEFHLFKLDDPHMAPDDASQPGRPPSVSLLSHGYQYLSEQRFDQIEPAVAINKEIDLRFVLAYTPLEYRDALHAIANGKLNCEPLITGTVGLDGGDAAFTALGDPERHAKILIDPASPVSVLH